MSALAAAKIQTALGEFESLTLAHIDTGQSIHQVLETLLLTAEVASGGGMAASILLVDDAGQHLMHGAAPNLPMAYCQAIHGLAIGPSAGSCGTAAYLGRPVYVSDIDQDPLWDNYRDLARRYALKACWSTPILDGQGKVLGTFALYHHTPRSPTREELGAIDLISHAVKTAILRYRQRA